jgi:hypothetical protein
MANAPITAITAQDGCSRRIPAGIAALPLPTGLPETAGAAK